jgi:hypothetical protein
MVTPTHTLAEGGAVVCSAGCPVVIYAEDWAHHLNYHNNAGGKP